MTETLSVQTLQPVEERHVFCDSRNGAAPEARAASSYQSQRRHIPGLTTSETFSDLSTNVTEGWKTIDFQVPNVLYGDRPNALVISGGLQHLSSSTIPADLPHLAAGSDELKTRPSLEVSCSSDADSDSPGKRKQRVSFSTTATDVRKKYAVTDF
jgi:hypothetical protein